MTIQKHQSIIQGGFSKATQTTACMRVLVILIIKEKNEGIFKTARKLQD